MRYWSYHPAGSESPFESLVSLMSNTNMLRQRDPCRAVDVAVPVPRQRFLKTVACFVINGLARGKIRRGDINMDSLRSLLEEYLPIISLDDQEGILHNLDQ